MQVSWKIVLLVALGGIVCLGGCVPEKKQPGQKQVVFYPEPPDPPRFQFLRSFAGSRDFAAETSAFDTFVTGRSRDNTGLDKPFGVATVKDAIYVADSNRTVMKFDLAARKFARLQGAKGLGEVIEPLNIAVDDQGNKFVTDTVRKQVLQYDRRDFYVKSFRVKKGWRPVGVATYKDMVFVCDAKNHEVQVFDRDSGALLQSFGQEGAPEERMGLPLNIAIGGDGTIYISDVGRIRVKKYDLDGHFLGDIGEAGSSPGHFARPRGIAVDRENRLYVVDATFDVVQVFLADDGQVLTFFGGPGDGPGNLYLPAGIYIDYDNVAYFKKEIDANFEVEYLVVVVSQFGARPVNVYGFGRQKGMHYPSLDELRDLRKQQIKELQEQGR